MSEQNHGDRAYYEERSREKARIAVRNEVEGSSRPKKKKSLAEYVSYLAISVIFFAFFYYFGSIFDVSVSSILDKGFIIALLVIVAVFYASIKEWI